jgi:hypothetical protein
VLLCLWFFTIDTTWRTPTNSYQGIAWSPADFCECFRRSFSYLLIPHDFFPSIFDIRSTNRHCLDQQALLHSHLQRATDSLFVCGFDISKKKVLGVAPPLSQPFPCVDDKPDTLWLSRHTRSRLPSTFEISRLFGSGSTGTAWITPPPNLPSSCSKQFVPHRLPVPPNRFISNQNAGWRLCRARL